MKSILSFIIFISFIYASEAQNFHINTYIGVANYYGDLQSKRYTFKQSKPAFGLGVSYDVTENLFIRTGFTFAKVAADDKFNPATEIRNLNFTSSVTEAHLAAEYRLRNLTDYSLAPYIFAGVALYHFNPYTNDVSGTKYFLQPLSTEGQGFYPNREPYKLTQLAIPFGGGLKLALSENITVGFEVGFRKLFTDYLDDVSATYVDPNLLVNNRGSKSFDLAFRSREIKAGAGLPYPLEEIRGGEKYKDWYYFTMFTTSFKINKDGKSPGKSRVGCPTRIY